MKPTNIIIDDYQSQGYGQDSEIDAQDFINEMGGNGSAFIEGDSNVIDEEEEHNQSLD